LRFLANVGDSVRSLHATSAGKALLGSLREQALSAFLKSTMLTSMTPQTITSKTALREELSAGNARGWFVNREESQHGVTTVSARFMWTSVLYIVTIAGPTSRLGSKLTKAAELLVGACRLLESTPGG
jgi:DNA-binding IclR family transcriptional regulator